MNNVLKSIAVLVMTLTITVMGKIFGVLDARFFDQYLGLLILLMAGSWVILGFGIIQGYHSAKPSKQANSPKYPY